LKILLEGITFLRVFAAVALSGGTPLHPIPGRHDKEKPGQIYLWARD
jgi:hypothetical protein